MHRLLLIGALLLSGCQSVIGPFERRKPERVDDPSLSISEQERRGRSRLPLPDESNRVGPQSGVLLPGHTLPMRDGR
jgi:hypothetical protein